MADSFSKNLRQELMHQIPKGLTERQALLAGIFCTDKPDKGLDLATSVEVAPNVSEYVLNLFSLLQFKANVRQLSSTVKISVAPESMEEFIGCFSMCFTDKSADILSSSEEFRRNFLKGAFIACGYCSDPHKSYRVELHIRNSKAVSLVIWMLHGNDIEPSVTVRDNISVIRFRSGDSVSTFFALIGASAAFLEFESIRVDKEIQGRVNRAVNCDSGNARRQADAGARRTALFTKLLASEVSASIPKELLKAAQVHIDNPGLSISELGALMDPPIGKSGMNHRLKKLEEIASEL